MAKRAPYFSIITPAYNAAAYIEAALRRTLSQTLVDAAFEVIVVDDGSSDNTFAILNQLASTHSQLRVIRAEQNQGPGAARNLALIHACGEWLVFVDSDDHLEPDALSKLYQHINQQDKTLDLIGYNWAFADGSKTPQRKDQQALKLSKQSLIQEYLALHMDGSVIFTAVRHALIQKHQLKFANGYHEDVDFMFMLYWHAQSINYLDEVLYRKDNRTNSIVNSISAQHITGFLRAWRAIATTLAKGDWAQYQSGYQRGLTGVIATRLREIYRRCSDAEQAAPLYAQLYQAWLTFADIGMDVLPLKDGTKYALIAQYFMQTMRDSDNNKKNERLIHSYLGDIMNKSWSCIDLHHSVFLGPDEVRTCCKRFFVDGKMRGDVALIKIPEGQIMPVTPVRILKEKQKLHEKINQGAPNACSGCPFLEFKDWGALDTLDVKYLSFEYHSVCNLKCSYCSDTYYGGKQARYDVKGLVDKLLDGHMLDNCSTIVWGGGEPVIGKDFDVMLEKTVTQIPKATQRVLTNSVKHSKIVERFLQEDKISVTTSIDAGSEATFKQVRGMASLKKAMKNLKRYAEANANQLTIKYIFTEGNYSLDEVRGFINLMHDYNLIDCNFQISCDFKHETIALDAVISMIAMYGLLTDANCRLVFFDDLLRQRLGEAHRESEPQIRAALSELGLGHILADRNAYKSVAIWGAGWQSKYLIEKSAFFKDVDVEYFIDSRTSRQGERFMNHDIVGPETLLNSDIPVVIAAVQNLPIIYKSFVDLGIDESRLIKQLII